MGLHKFFHISSKFHETREDVVGKNDKIQHFNTRFKILDLYFLYVIKISQFSRQFLAGNSLYCNIHFYHLPIISLVGALTLFLNLFLYFFINALIFFFKSIFCQQHSSSNLFTVSALNWTDKYV